MKNNIFLGLSLLLIGLTFTQCRNSRFLKKRSKPIATAIATKDSSAVVKVNSIADSILLLNNAKVALQKTRIDFKTFSAKIKLDLETNEGKQPDLTAKVMMLKDSLVWISISTNVVGIPAEIFRALISKDSVILMDKLKRSVQYRRIDYLQDLTNIPFDLKTIQDVIIGNVVFFDNNKFAVRKTEKYTLINTLASGFKNLITINNTNNTLDHCKLDDINIEQNRTADFTFSDYNLSNKINFATQREITVTEKNKLNVSMFFKQFDFDKEISINFNVPKSYKKK